MECVGLRLVHGYAESCKVNNVIPLSAYVDKEMCRSLLTAKSGIADLCKARETTNITKKADDYHCPDNNAA